MLRSLQEKFGPGLLFAASAVGVSHLVQSTRGGAVYGLTMLALVVFICLLKYPIFLFSARYTAVTGDTLLDGYGRLGKWILCTVFFILLFELPFAISGVSIVTAGVVKSATGIGLSDVTVSALSVFGCIIVLTIGRYSLLENISKFFVVVFTFCIIAAAILSFQGIEAESVNPVSQLEFNKETILFLVAISGWMPTGVAGALGVSLWIYAKSKKIGRRLTLREVNFDFNLGYGIVIFTACCFSTLGSNYLYSRNQTLEEGSAAFATQLINMFISALGQWTYYIIVLGSIVVMFSSLLILVDLVPRIASEALIRLMPKKLGPKDQPRLYVYFILYEVVAVAVVFSILFDSFETFIDLVTSIGFLATPVIAYLNYKVIFSEQVPKAMQPSLVLRTWGIVTIVFLSITTMVYLYLNTFH